MRSWIWGAALPCSEHPGLGNARQCRKAMQTEISDRQALDSLPYSGWKESCLQGFHSPLYSAILRCPTGCRSGPT